MLVSVLLGGACRKEEPKQEAPSAAGQNVEAAPAAVASEIKLGQTMPYSGPASAYGAIGKLHAVFFAKLNREGGINGKKVNLISLDDAYSPPKAVEQTRKLVEQDKVIALFNSVGTASNSAVHKYLNEKQVPQLFASSGATKWADPKNFPWTIGYNPSYQREGRTYAEHILKANPKAKVAVLYQNDDLGKDLLAGLKSGLGEGKNIVAEASYESSDPTVDSQIVTLRASKADTLVIFTTPKFGAQAIRKVHDLKWKPQRYITNVSASIATVLTPAGLDASKGLFTVGYMKDPQDKRWENDADIKEWFDFMKAEYPQGDVKDGSNVYAYVTAKTLVHVLKQCGDDLSAKNVMKQAASLKDFDPGLLQPGVTINTSADDFELFDKLNLAQFDGAKWGPLEAAGAAAAPAVSAR
jgi:ABC-type branched-subunit amino acid transport system substrate-binding protein